MAQLVVAVKVVVDLVGEGRGCGWGGRCDFLVTHVWLWSKLDSFPTRRNNPVRGVDGDSSHSFSHELPRPRIEQSLLAPEA